MNELERAIILLLQVQLGLSDVGHEDPAELQDELRAILFTLYNRRTGHLPYHRTYRGAHALEGARARDEDREPDLISEDDFNRREN